MKTIVGSEHPSKNDNTFAKTKNRHEPFRNIINEMHLLNETDNKPLIQK